MPEIATASKPLELARAPKAKKLSKTRREKMGLVAWEELGPELSRMDQSVVLTESARDVSLNNDVVISESVARKPLFEAVELPEGQLRGRGREVTQKITTNSAVREVGPPPSPAVDAPRSSWRRARRANGLELVRAFGPPHACFEADAGIALNKMKTHCFVACGEAIIPLNKMETHACCM